MRLINADELKKDLICFYPEGVPMGLAPETLFKQILQDIDNAPTVEYPFYQEAYQSGYEEGNNERPQGEWIKHSTYKDVLICSKCNHGSNQFYDTFKFCPNCGAQMKTRTETD